MDDMRVVLEAAGSDRALVVGSDEGSQMAALYAATHPDATAGLVLFQPLAHIPDLTDADLETLREELSDGGRNGSPTSCWRTSVQRSCAAKPTASGSRTGCVSAPAPRSGSR